MKQVSLSAIKLSGTDIPGVGTTILLAPLKVTWNVVISPQGTIFPVSSRITTSDILFTRKLKCSAVYLMSHGEKGMAVSLFEFGVWSLLGSSTWTSQLRVKWIYAITHFLGAISYETFEMKIKIPTHCHSAARTIKCTICYAWPRLFLILQYDLQLL